MCTLAVRAKCNHIKSEDIWPSGQPREAPWHHWRRHVHCQVEGKLLVGHGTTSLSAIRLEGVRKPIKTRVLVDFESEVGWECVVPEPVVLSAYEPSRFPRVKYVSLLVGHEVDHRHA